MVGNVIWERAATVSMFTTINGRCARKIFSRCHALLPFPCAIDSAKPLSEATFGSELDVIVYCGGGTAGPTGLAVGVGRQSEFPGHRTYFAWLRGPTSAMLEISQTSHSRRRAALVVDVRACVGPRQ